jgi:hypothetical protein
MARSLLLVAAAGAVSGCAYVDNFGPRASTMNRTITDYRNEATLLNIVRAANSDPMDFVALTSATGHSTFNASEGVPTFVLGPHTAPTATSPAAARNYVFGPNTLQESATTDFNVSLLDDPQSYTALMTPVDAGMIAFFRREGTPPEVLLPLFISEIRITSKSGNETYAFYTDQSERSRSFIFCSGLKDHRCQAENLGLPGSGNPQIEEKLIQCHAKQARCIPPGMLAIAYLVDRGIWFQVPIGTIPGQQQQQPTPTSVRICFDQVYQTDDGIDASGNGLSFEAWLMKLKEGDANDDPRVRKISFLKVDQWGAGARPTVSAHYKCDDKATPWITLGGTGSAQPPGGGGAPNPNPNPRPVAVPGKSAKQDDANRTPAYTFYDGHSVIQIYTRSTWSIYQFLGNLIQRQTTDGTVSILSGGLRGDQSLFRVVRGGYGGDCFASVTYSGENYCIPKDAYNSKRIISVVHELANLYTKPNNAQQPNTGTFRATQ